MPEKTASPLAVQSKRQPCRGYGVPCGLGCLCPERGRAMPYSCRRLTRVDTGSHPPPDQSPLVLVEQTSAKCHRASACFRDLQRQVSVECAYAHELKKNVDVRSGAPSGVLARPSRCAARGSLVRVFLRRPTSTVNYEPADVNERCSVEIGLIWRKQIDSNPLAVAAKCASVK